MKKEAGTINITPTWTTAAKIYLSVLLDGTPEGKKIAREEIMRMANLLDRFVADTEKNKKK